VEKIHKHSEIDEGGRCQSILGEMQCELPAGHVGEHREGRLKWKAGDQRLQPKRWTSI
jgi:hypothetical protein